MDKSLLEHLNDEVTEDLEKYRKMLRRRLSEANRTVKRIELLLTKTYEADVEIKESVAAPDTYIEHSRDDKGKPDVYIEADSALDRSMVRAVDSYDNLKSPEMPVLRRSRSAFYPTTPVVQRGLSRDSVPGSLKRKRQDRLCIDCNVGLDATSPWARCFPCQQKFKIRLDLEKEHELGDNPFGVTTFGNK